MLRKFFVLALLALALAALSAASTAHAANLTFIVGKAIDAPDANPGDGKCKSTSGGCTLRAAVEELNTSGGGRIYLKQGQTYTLTQGTLYIMQQIFIHGTGRTSNIIQGDAQNSIGRIFTVQNNGYLAMMDVTLKNAREENGGAILAQAGASVLLDRVDLTDNEAGDFGGAIYNQGALLMSDSTMDNNVAALGGGALYNDGTADIYYSTLSNNRANQQIGGAIVNTTNHTLTMVNSTVSGNRAGWHGGGIYNGINGTVKLYNTTVASNRANTQENGSKGGGLYNFGGTFTLHNSLIADNVRRAVLKTVQDDCDGTVFQSPKPNLIEHQGDCLINDSAMPDTIGVEPNLAPLANNGGATKTHSFNGPSAAVDAGDQGGCRVDGSGTLFFDQRRYARTVDGNNTGTVFCDLGALEYMAPDPCATKPAQSAPALPVDGAEFKPRIITLTWDRTDCASFYKLTIKQNDKKGPTVHQASNLAGLHYITPKLAKHQTYVWRVQACNAHGCGKAKFKMFRIK